MPVKALIVSAVATERLRMTRLGRARRLVGAGLLAVLASGLPAPSPARAQGPGLSLLLSVNQSVFGPGTTLEVTLGVTHAGPPVVVDLLFGAILADGESVVFLEGAGLSPRPGRLSQLELASVRPMVAALSLGDGATGAVPDILRYTWQGSEPLGTYRLFFVATRPNALRDGQVDPGDLVAVQTVSVALLPPASVTVDAARSASATVSIEGGTVAATAADGTT
jgi:hypothetical protein